jgi:hypothetical protein
MVVVSKPAATAVAVAVCTHELLQPTLYNLNLTRVVMMFMCGTDQQQ